MVFIMEISLKPNVQSSSQIALNITVAEVQRSVSYAKSLTQDLFRILIYEYYAFDLFMRMPAGAAQAKHLSAAARSTDQRL